MTETKTKVLNKGQLAFIERNRQRIAAMPPAVCAKCGDPRKRKNKYCHRCWTNMQSFQANQLKQGVPNYAHCAKSPTKAHEWVLDMQNRGVCKWCKKSRQFTAVIGGDGWGHDEKELAYVKARVNAGNFL